MKAKIKIPTIVLDIDDVMFRFIPFLCFLYNNKHSTTITESDITSWNFYDTKVEDAQGQITKGAQLRKFFKEYENAGIYAALPPIRMSIQSIELIKRLGYKVIFLTARSSNFKKDTEISFALHKLPYDEIIFDADKPKQINRLARKHNIVAFVDDRYKHVIDVFNTDKVQTCYLMNKPNNLTEEVSDDIIRVNDLLEVVRQLKDVKEDIL